MSKGARKRNKRPIFREAIEVLERLEVLDGKLEREALLRKHRDNKALQAFVKMTVGPDRYYVRPSVNLVCTSSMSPVESWRAFLVLTRQLKNRQLTGTKAKKAVNTFLTRCRPLLMKWYCRVLNHDLRCGVSVNTVKNIWGDQFLLGDSAKGAGWRYCGCALAKKYEDVYKTREPKFPLALEIKYDGERANLICFPRDDQVFVLTRSARRRKPVESVVPWRQQVLSLCRRINEGVNPDRPLFLDGEFLGSNWNETGVVRRTTNFDPTLFLDRIRLMLWDWAPLDQYQAGKFDMKWLRRKAVLLHAAGATRPQKEAQQYTTNVWVAGHIMVYDHEQLMFEYNQLLDEDHEGAVVKVPDAPHVFKRTITLLKLKPEEEITGRVVDILPGEDQHGPVEEAVRASVHKLMLGAGPVKVTEQYIHCKTKDVDKLQTRLHKLLRGDNEQRVSNHREGVVSFRYGPRMGSLVVELDDGTLVNVGGGFEHKAGRDQRAWFWRERETLLGVLIDFKQTAGNTAETTARYPNFVRIREDLS